MGRKRILDDSMTVSFMLTREMHQRLKKTQRKMSKNKKVSFSECMRRIVDEVCPLEQQDLFIR